MTDQTDFDGTFEDHCINLVVDELHIHYWVCHSAILDWRVNRNVETVELNHFLDAPDSELAIQTGAYEICSLWLYWCKGCHTPRMSFKNVYWLGSASWIPMDIVFHLIFINAIDINIFELHQLSEMDVAKVMSSDEEFLFFEHKQISDEILFDRRVIISWPDFSLLILTFLFERIK